MSILENEFLQELRKVVERHPRGYQTHLAGELGVRTASLSNMINGRRGIDENLRAKLALLTGINLKELIEKTGALDGEILRPKPMEYTVANLDPHEWEFIQAYRAGGRDRALLGKFTEKLKRLPYLPKK